ncbi:hypothetical protein ACTZWT_23200 [Rhodopseudomonas sp. NSM]|uniref:hypothetical protein n=1 Tax=Rhodopseudomonas sp. NSM TaxID=3457630 RepID=UPI0040373DE7
MTALLALAPVAALTRTIKPAPAEAGPLGASAAVRPDPVFAAIERHRAAVELARARALDVEKLQLQLPAGISDESDRLDREFAKAIAPVLPAAKSLAATKPTTVLGLLSFLSYVESRTIDDAEFDEGFIDHLELQLLRTSGGAAAALLRSNDSTVPTIPAPSTAPDQPDPVDPIYAKIRDAKSTWSRWARMMGDLDADEISAVRRIGPKPDDAKALRAWHRTAGIDHKRKSAVARAEREAHRAALTFSRTKPTTAAGVAAALTYVQAELRDSEFEPIAMKSITGALRRLAQREATMV